MLDLQIQEKQNRERLKRYQEQREAEAISKDVQEYQELEKKKKENQERLLQEHKYGLQRQIEDSKTKNQISMAEEEFKLNKQLLDGSAQTTIKKPF